MRIVYKPKIPIDQQIRQAKFDADCQNKDIEHIVLTNAEWGEFCAFCYSLVNKFNDNYWYSCNTGSIQYYGVIVKKGY